MCEIIKNDGVESVYVGGQSNTAEGFDFMNATIEGTGGLVLRNFPNTVDINDSSSMVYYGKIDTLPSKMQILKGSTVIIVYMIREGIIEYYQLDKFSDKCLVELKRTDSLKTIFDILD